MRLSSFVAATYLITTISLSSLAVAESKPYVLCVKDDNLTIRPGKRCRSTETKATVSGINTTSTNSLNSLAATVSELGTSLENRFDGIPSGKTVTGVIGYDAENVDSSGDYWVVGSLPAPSSAELTEDTVTVVNNAIVSTSCSGTSCLDPNEKTESDGSGCTGSTAAPTAPAGRLCIYPISLSHVQLITGTNMGSSKQGFTVSMSTDGSSAGTDLYFHAAWAYTAP